uniref:cancer-related nucleoside-triphosphatase isoform X2 n=1 Tax=Myxine glutinosa TaxID=7769 RepID=UPI00358F8C33
MAFKHVFLTGIPGVGKSTLIQKVCEVLQTSDCPAVGFYTQEVRQAGRRTGFDVVTLAGSRGPLARVSGISAGHGDCRVGQYIVDVNSFEQLVIPILTNVSSNDTYVVDEIGKMELFSQAFRSAVGQLLDRPGTTVLGTLPAPRSRSPEFVEKVRNRQDVKVFTITKENRNSILNDVIDAVRACRQRTAKDI